MTAVANAKENVSRAKTSQLVVTGESGSCSVLVVNNRSKTAAANTIKESFCGKKQKSIGICGSQSVDAVENGGRAAVANAIMDWKHTADENESRD